MNKNYTFLATLAIGCVIFASCSEQKSTAKTTSPAEESAKGKVLNLYTWEDYFDEDTIKAFEEKTGAKVVYKTFENTDEMEAKLLSQPGEYDVVVAEGRDLEKLRGLNLIRDLDQSKLPNLKNIGAEFRGMPFDPQDKISAPYVWGTTLVAYRKDVIPNPKKSWSLLHDERVKGKVMLHDERQSVIRIQLFSLGHPYNTTNPAHIVEATDLLLKNIEQSSARLGSDVDVRNGLANESLYAAMSYSGDAAMVAEENENIGWFIPEEGAPLWIDCFAVTERTNVPTLAHAFINHMLDAEIGAMNANTVWFATPNKASEPFLNADLLADESIYPTPAVMERCQWYTKITPSVESMFNQGWLRVLSKIRTAPQTASVEDSTDE